MGEAHSGLARLEQEPSNAPVARVSPTLWGEVTGRVWLGGWCHACGGPDTCVSDRPPGNAGASWSQDPRPHVNSERRAQSPG